MSYIDSGKEQGAKIHVGGGRVGNEGYFIEVPPFLCLPSRIASIFIRPPDPFSPQFSPIPNRI